MKNCERYQKQLEELFKEKDFACKVAGLSHVWDCSSDREYNNGKF